MASTVTELLRRRFGGKKEVDPLEGWTLGYRLNIAGEVEAATCAISPYLDADENSAVTYYNPTTSATNKAIWTYDDNLVGTYLGWASKARGEYTFTMPTGRTKFRITMALESLDDAYIKDANNNYIWKGKNV